MNTHVNKLRTILPSSLNDKKMLEHQENQKDKNRGLSERFIPVPYSHMEDSALPEWQVRFEVLKTDPPVDFCLEINGDIIFGVDPSQTDVINLSRYNNKIRGVSRRHLKLSPTDTGLLMTDLNSTNGTRRNGRLVQPNTPYNIYNGDILELGDLTLAVNIVKAPIDTLVLTEDTENIVNALTHISTAITSNLNPDDVLDRILEMAINLCQADEIALLLWDEHTNELSLRAERGIGENKTRLMKVPMKKEYPFSKVLRTGEPLRDKVTKGHKSKIVTGFLVEAVLYTPITVGEATIGILIAMHSSKEKEFTLEDERMLCTIGKFAAIAIQNSQKYQATNLKLQRKLEELSSYNDISQQLSKTNNLIGIYSVLREQIRKHWEVENIGLWLLDETTKTLVPFPKPSFHKTYSFGEELIGSVASCAEPILARDIKLFSEPTQAIEPTLQLLARSAACVPIMESNKVLGVLAAFSRKENEFDEDDINLLQIFSQAAAPEIRNAWLFEQVDKQRATILAAVNMLPHPMMIVDQDGKIIVSNKAADAMLAEIHSSLNGDEGSNTGGLIPLSTLIQGLSESKWRTREIIVGEKVYIATLEYASMVGTVILMQDVTDPVTGTSSHRHFQDVAEQVFQQAKRYTKPLAALIIGLDDIQRVSNEQGHAIGNHILKRLATEIRSFLRAPDILGRYQENEFIAILPETNLENAKGVAERILRSISKKAVLADNYKITPKLTIGVATLDPTTDNSVEAFMEKAYRAFMLAKNEKSHIQVYKNAGL